jgi:hypothetical protein
VTDSNGSMLFIIECKTWGREFDKALSNTNNDGGQLFSYWQQEQSCKWLIMYASDLKEGYIEYKAPTIDCSDDANIDLLAKKDKSIRLFRDAHTAPEKHEASFSRSCVPFGSIKICSCSKPSFCLSGEKGHSLVQIARRLQMNRYGIHVRLSWESAGSCG